MTLTQLGTFLGYDRDELLLREGTLEIGEWTSPEDIDGDTDPLTFWESTAFMGFYKRGTFKTNLTVEFARFESDTMAQLVRVDPIRKSFFFEMMVAQNNEGLWNLAQGLLVVEGAVTNFGFVGSSEPQRLAFGYLRSTELVNGRPFYNAIWNGMSTGEDESLAPSGDEHNSYAFKAEAIIGDAFLPQPDQPPDAAALLAQKNYGGIWFGDIPSAA